MPLFGAKKKVQEQPVASPTQFLKLVYGCEEDSSNLKLQLVEIQKQLRLDPGILQAKDKNGRNCLHLVQSVSAFNILSKRADLLDRKDADGNMPIHVASQYEIRLDIVKLLVKHQPLSLDSKNARGFTPFLNACEARCLSVAQHIAQQQPAVADQTDKYDNTALHILLGWKRTKRDKEVLISFVKWLLEVRPSLQSTPDRNGNTPLLVACSNGWLAAAQYLHKRDPETLCALNRKGQTALHVVAANKFPHRVAFCRWILKAQSGDMLSVLDKRGQTPLMTEESCNVVQEVWETNNNAVREFLQASTLRVVEWSLSADDEVSSLGDKSEVSAIVDEDSIVQNSCDSIIKINDTDSIVLADGDAKEEVHIASAAAAIDDNDTRINETANHSTGVLSELESVNVDFNNVVVLQESTSLEDNQHGTKEEQAGFVTEGVVLNRIRTSHPDKNLEEEGEFKLSNLDHSDTVNSFVSKDRSDVGSTPDIQESTSSVLGASAANSVPPTEGKKNEEGPLGLATQSSDFLSLAHHEEKVAAERGGKFHSGVGRETATSVASNEQFNRGADTDLQYTVTPEKPSAGEIVNAGHSIVTETDNAVETSSSNHENDAERRNIEGNSTTFAVSKADANSRLANTADFREMNPSAANSVPPTEGEKNEEGPLGLATKSSDFLSLAHHEEKVAAERGGKFHSGVGRETTTSVASNEQFNRGADTDLQYTVTSEKPSAGEIVNAGHSIVTETDNAVETSSSNHENDAERRIIEGNSTTFAVSKADANSRLANTADSREMNPTVAVPSTTRLFGGKKKDDDQSLSPTKFLKLVHGCEEDSSSLKLQLIQIQRQLRLDPGIVQSKDKIGRNCLHLAQSVSAFRILAERAELLERKDADGNLPIHTASQYESRLDIVKLVVKRQPMTLDSKNERGFTPFLKACEARCLSVAQHFAQQQPAVVDQTDKYGNTALHILLGWKRTKRDKEVLIPFVEWLLEMRLSLQSTPDRNGNTPLLVACSNGWLAAAQYLHKRNPETLCALNKKGQTALHVVAAHKFPHRVAFCRWILKAQSGDMLSVLDKTGQTPLMTEESCNLVQEAWETNNNAVREFLLASTLHAVDQSTSAGDEVSGLVDTSEKPVTSDLATVGSPTSPVSKAPVTADPATAMSPTCPVSKAPATADPVTARSPTSPVSKGQSFEGSGTVETVSSVRAPNATEKGSASGFEPPVETACDAVAAVASPLVADVGKKEKSSTPLVESSTEGYVAAGAIIPPWAYGQPRHTLPNRGSNDNPQPMSEPVSSTQQVDETAPKPSSSARGVPKVSVQSLVARWESLSNKK